MIINIRKGVFGDCIRGGDLVAIGNVVEHLRKVNNNPNIRFWIDPKATSSDRYVQDFHSFLISIGRYGFYWNNPNIKNIQILLRVI